MAIGAIRNVFLLLSKERVTERAFAICSIKFSPENLYAWTFSSGRLPKSPKTVLEKNSKSYLHESQKDRSKKSKDHYLNSLFKVAKL